MRVIYQAPDAGVSCEWVVLLSPDGTSGSILDQNEDATRYFLDRISADDAKPLVLTRRLPIYPPIAVAALVKGDVKFQLVVGPDGKFVGNPVSGPPMLTGAATDAIKGWTFKPLILGGRAVSFQTEVTFHFATTGGPFSSVTSTP
jgi:hypothetical protein